jgi:hypothetical protein
MIKLAVVAAVGVAAGWLARGYLSAGEPPPPARPEAALEAGWETAREKLVDACVWTYESSPSRAVKRHVADALHDVGVELLEPAGEPFDAARHDPVGEEVTAPGAVAGNVARTLRPGVLDGGRVLRPAQVVVFAYAKGRPTMEVLRDLDR